MKRNCQIISFPYLLRSLILSCSCFLVLISCSKTELERNMQFNDQWCMVSSENHKSRTYTNQFEADLQGDRLYLLEVLSKNKLQHVYINNTFITGSSTKNNKINFNITDYLKSTNTIEITFDQVSEFNAEIHQVNKLFIPQIHLNKPNAGVTLVEVQVKNAFNTEKQGVLKYILYSNDKKLFEKETPVFISGNTENLYRQHLPFSKNTNDTKGLKVVCRLYSEGKLLDKNTDDLSF